MLEILLVVAVVVAAGFLIVKKVSASAALLFAGLLMLAGSWLLGHVNANSFQLEVDGNSLTGQLQVIEEIIKKQLTGSGLIIMVLFGYTAYMDTMGANQRTVEVLAKPLTRMSGRAKLLMVPAAFLLANLMSLAVPSGSSLAVLLGATMYPALVGAGMSRLTAGAIIATSATIMPTPLGADSVEAAAQLGMAVDDYSFAYNAKVAIPTILIMAIVHMFWQRYMDKKDAARASSDSTAKDARPSAGADAERAAAAITKVEASTAPAIYALLPVLPLLLVLVLYITNLLTWTDVKLGLVQVTFISIVVALICEAIRLRKPLEIIDNLKAFFKGMGAALVSVVSLIIAAGMLIEGILQTGVLGRLITAAGEMQGAAFIITLAFVGVAILLGFMTGSGLAAFFSLIPVVPGVASRAAVAGPMISLPLQHASSLARAGSPVSASTLIVCGLIKEEPQVLLKRTLVPVFAGILSSLILSWTIL